MEEGCCSFALVSISNPRKPYAVNKDLNGGFGTADDYQAGVLGWILRWMKKTAVRIPVISFAVLQAVLKEKGHHVRYFETALPAQGRHYDVILLNGSIVDYQYENQTAQRLKELFPRSKVGFIGEFPSTKPELFEQGDFVIVGEPEEFFMHEFHGVEQLRGQVLVKALTNYDDLPTPDLEGFRIEHYRYSFLNGRRKMVTYQSSKGCPYSCSYYCTYGRIQGPRIRQRSAAKVAQDLAIFEQRYGIQYVQFRDPVFGFQKGFIEEFCREVKAKRLSMSWGIETRLDLLTRDLIDQMYEVGLRLINCGVETVDVQVADTSRRKLIQASHQEQIVRYCLVKGIKVSAFYVLGLEGDTPASIRRTLAYAMHLNTPLARFSVATPYPGTAFFDQLEQQGRIQTHDYEQYTQFNLVFKHPHLERPQVQDMLVKAYLRYYLRLRYVLLLLKLWVQRASQ